MRRLTLPAAVPTGLSVWQVDLKAPFLVDFPQSLSASEKARAREYAHVGERDRFLRTRAALRTLLSQALSCPPDDIRLETGPYGKPQLQPDHRSHLAFNVSHAGNFALIALSENREVGVDIECFNPELNIHELAPSVLTPAEYQRVRGSQQPVRAFFHHWVGKEAVLKALGVGIGQLLTHLSLSPEERGNYNIHLGSLNDLNHPSCYAHQLVAPEGYVAALAWLR